MKDLIERQAAIEAIMKAAQEIEDDIHLSLTMAQGARAMVVEIEHLSSAQPEHTCVNCGRTVNNGGWYADGRTRCPIEEHYALPKDGYCHLWEKRNVTNDDYPER